MALMQSDIVIGYGTIRKIESGENLNNTMVNFGGSMFVSSGGTAMEIKENGGYVSVADGATVSFRSNTISDLYLDTNSATVHSGTTANRTVLERNLDLWYDAFGAMYVYSDGIANDTTALSGGKLHVEKDGKANSTILSGGSLFVSEGGTANSTTIYEEGYLNVFNGGTANNTTVNNGFFAVLSGGTANSTTVNDGSFAVLSGGTANATTIFGGSLLVSSGGTATDVVWTPCEGRVEVDKGAVVTFASQYSGVYYGSRNQLLSNAAVMENMMLTPLCEMIVMTGGTANNITASSFSEWDMDMVPIYVSSGGAVNDTTLVNGGRLYVYSDAEANGTLVQGGASLVIFNGGITNNTTVNQYGYFIINSGGSADGITVNPGGALIIRSGGTATDVVWTPCEGRVTFEDGAHVTFTSQYSGVYYGRVDYFEVTLSSAVVMNDVTVARTNEEMYVMSGGTAVNTTVSGVLSELVDDIFDKDNLGSMHVCSGGTAVNTHAVHGGNIVISSGGIANDTTVTAAFLTVLSGGTANGITVENASYPFDVSEEEFVSCFGSVFVSSGGMVNGATVKRGCNLSVSSGAIATGKMVLEAWAGVSMDEGAILDFDISGLTPEAEARVNDLSRVHGAPTYTLTVDGTQAEGVYTLAAGAAGFASTISVVNAAGDTLGTLTVGGEAVSVGSASYTLTLSDSTLSVTVETADTPVPLSPTNPVGTADKVSWEADGTAQYVVEYSTDNFEHVIRVITTGNAVDTPELPAGTYQWRVKADANSEWAVGEAITVEPEADAAPKVVQSNEDGSEDLFFAAPEGMWSNIYYAQHVGSVNDWTGTNEVVSANGKGRIQNLFFGSADPNVLCLTDGDNGDAIFVDDIYTDLPESVAEHTARLYKIQEVRAGAGDDIVDMTSQQFEYIGDGLTIRGGDGNDTIWANKGDNFLFGDAGNDRIVGASGNDVLVGGIGNDSMHGGGGNDVFTFCDNWGTDEVEQLSGGSVTLWFASGDESNWNAETLTYTDGDNSVKVFGVTADKVTLKFGDDGSAQFASLANMGAFFDATSERIFEESGKGILASL